MNTLKTTLLMVALFVLFVGVGYVIGGQAGALMAFIFAGVMNFGMYWFSDRIVLAQYGAKEITESEAPELHRVVGRLAEKGGIPKPGVYLIQEDNPNAFATGRNPENAAVAVTSGLMELLSEDELEGVLAHELSHVMNRDTLISTVAATFAAAIGYLAMIARFSAIFGVGGRDRNNNIVALLVMAIIAPLAATLIQFAISRSREFKADRSGARLSGKPMSLAAALRKLERGAQRRPMKRGRAETASLFIVNPFSLDNVQKWFSTHPPVDDRVRELEKMARDV